MRYQRLNLAIVILFMKSSTSKCEIEATLALVGYILSTPIGSRLEVDNNILLFVESNYNKGLS